MSNEIPTLPEYPQLPVLSMQQCCSVFKAAGLGPSYIACSTGYSRMSASRWMNGHETKPNKPTLLRVSTLAYKVLRAIKNGHFKDKHQSNVDRHKVLVDLDYDTPLAQCSPESLLPKSWLEQFNLPREQDATATIL